MKENIIDQRQKIETQENVIIFYACESGSRAWGFPSNDSDFDVRFLYMHPIDWYVSIAEKRDVIERPLHARLDISGWDLKKALGLFRESNPPLLEWLDSLLSIRKSIPSPHKCVNWQKPTIHQRPVFTTIYIWRREIFVNILRAKEFG